MNISKLTDLTNQLVALPAETEYVEFKLNNSSAESIGEYISAMSNVAALMGQSFGYVVWGIEDETHKIVGTQFNPKLKKIGNQELESWLANHLHPRVDFRFHEERINDNLVVVLSIPAAFALSTLKRSRRL